MEVSAELIRDIVKEVLSEYPRGDVVASIPKSKHSKGILAIKVPQVKTEAYDVGVPAKVGIKDLVDVKESPKIGCGILEIDSSEYPWEMGYEEFYYVVEGILDIKIDDDVVRAEAGEILYIPKGISIRFCSPSSCRAVYFTYPADWENQ